MTEGERLLAQHQAIIDAWFAKWRADQKKRIDEFWLRKHAAGQGGKVP